MHIERVTIYTMEAAMEANESRQNEYIHRYIHSFSQIYLIKSYSSHQLQSLYDQGFFLASFLLLNLTSQRLEDADHLRERLDGRVASAPEGAEQTPS